MTSNRRASGQTGNLDLSDTEIAFRGTATARLYISLALFRALQSQTLAKFGGVLLSSAVQARLPVRGLVKPLFFKQFCGGESLSDCNTVIDQLASAGIGTTLDYAVEGAKNPKGFSKTMEEILSGISYSESQPAVRFVVFKPTALTYPKILEKASSNQLDTEEERSEWIEFVGRVDTVCDHAAKAGMKVYIDAEESWYQDAVDKLAEEMMRKYNSETATVYTTIQAYRVGRDDYLMQLCEKAKSDDFKVGVKLVRGAYMEKERERCARRNLPAVIHANKRETDRCYNRCCKLLMQHLDLARFTVATHNEYSTYLVAELMSEAKLKNSDPRIEFSQLYGMANHISYNLATKSYNVSKYVPYGPLRRVVPYLIRRAEENSSVAGGSSRELELLTEELSRRRS